VQQLNIWGSGVIAPPLDVSCQLHALAALISGYHFRYSLRSRLGRSQDRCGPYREETKLVSAGDRSPVTQPIAIPTELQRYENTDGELHTEKRGPVCEHNQIFGKDTTAERTGSDLAAGSS
jgi:hypothetical protein